MNIEKMTQKVSDLLALVFGVLFLMGAFARMMLYIHPLRKIFPYFGLKRTFYHKKVG